MQSDAVSSQQTQHNEPTADVAAASVKQTHPLTVEMLCEPRMEMQHVEQLKINRGVKLLHGPYSHAADIMLGESEVGNDRQMMPSSVDPLQGHDAEQAPTNGRVTTSLPSGRATSDVQR